MTVTYVSLSEQYEWVVQSESLIKIKIYTVKKIKESCQCRLKCDACQVCIHMMKCNCLDYSIRSNLCKHVHYIVSKIKDMLNKTSKEVATDDFSMNEELNWHIKQVERRKRQDSFKTEEKKAALVTSFTD